MSKFKKPNDSKSAGPTLDLHGQRMDGLEDRVDRFLVDSQKKGLHQVRIMTGKGSGQVRAAVEKYLKLGGYPYRFDTGAGGAANEGVLVVQI